MSNTLEPFLSNRAIELMTKVVLKKSEDALETNNDSLESILMNYENCDEKYHAGCEYNFALFLPILKWDTQIRIPNEESNLANIIKDTWQCDNYKESFTSLYNDINSFSVRLLRLSISKPLSISISFNVFKVTFNISFKFILILIF